MARYFFDTVDAAHDPDREGVELLDLAAARKYAIRFAGAVLNDEPSVLWDGRDFEVSVSDEHHTLLFILTAFVTNAPAARHVQ